MVFIDSIVYKRVRGSKALKTQFAFLSMFRMRFVYEGLFVSVDRRSRSGKLGIDGVKSSLRLDRDI